MTYIPEKGDAVWLNFNPQSGHEQAGHRPAVVISPKLYNQKVGLALFCPITNQAKGYPFEVVIPRNKKISGVVLSDQIKSLDWKARNVEFITKLPDLVIEKILGKIKTLM
ncbi:MAG: endoribonuclease MazF [Acidobacteriota bacterium]|jgi:mRNA interferase MazF|nr:endoribonuclease MazF [Acidobacteriota bacterium]